MRRDPPLHGRSQPEVHHLDPVVPAHQKVSRFHIPVHDTAGMGGAQAPGHLDGETQRPARSQATVPLQDLPQVAGFEVLHGDRVGPLEIQEIVDADDVVVGDLPGELEFLEEPPAGNVVGAELWIEDLENEAIVDGEVLDQVDRPEPPGLPAGSPDSDRAGWCREADRKS